MSSHELHESLKQMLQGDKNAFQLVYKQTYQLIYSTAYFLLNNKQDVHDVVNEVYIQLMKSLPRYDFSSSFHSWLNGLTIKQVHNWNRKLWRKLRLFNRSKELDMTSPVQQVEDRLLLQENKEELLAIVDTLSFKLKVIIILRYYHDYSYEEMSTALDIPIGTVKSRHHQAMQILRKKVGFSLENKKEATIHVS